MKSQEAALRAAPDILIATPGRLIDHLHNCPSFHLDSVEVLILDEADRYATVAGPWALWAPEGHARMWSCVVLHAFVPFTQILLPLSLVKL